MPLILINWVAIRHHCRANTVNTQVIERIYNYRARLLPNRFQHFPNRPVSIFKIDQMALPNAELMSPLFTMLQRLILFRVM